MTARGGCSKVTDMGHGFGGRVADCGWSIEEMRGEAGRQNDLSTGSSGPPFLGNKSGHMKCSACQGNEQEGQDQAFFSPNKVQFDESLALVLEAGRQGEVPKRKAVSDQGSEEGTKKVVQGQESSHGQGGKGVLCLLFG